MSVESVKVLTAAEMLDEQDARRIAEFIKMLDRALPGLGADGYSRIAAAWVRTWP